MIFPEALQNESEFETFRKAIDVPLMANMTEFGKSPLLNAKQLENLGYNLVIYPVATMFGPGRAQPLPHVGNKFLWKHFFLLPSLASWFFLCDSNSCGL
jgi:hypothetical protein